MIQELFGELSAVQTGGAYVTLLLAVLGLASAVARLTPNPKDDKIMGKIWKIVNHIGLRGGPVLILLLTFGCASYSIEFTDAKGNPVAVESSLGGRGCLAVTFNENGEVDLITQQDASSDWAGVRVIPTLAKVAITALFGDRSSGDGADFTGPSGIGGCKGLFESALDEEDGHTHEVMLE